MSTDTAGRTCLSGKQNKRMVDMELEQVSMGGRGSVSMGSHGRL